MKKILILSNSYEGLYKFRKELLSQLIKKYIVLVCAPFDKNYDLKIKKIGCEVIDVSLKRRRKNIFYEIILIKNYFKIFQKYAPDKVLLYTIKPNIYGGIFCRYFKIKYISTITGIGSAFQKKGILRKLLIFFMKISLKKAEKIFFQNKENLEFYLKNNIIKIGDTKLVKGSGVNLKEFKCEIKEKKGTIKILFIGRIMKEKGIEEFLEIAENIKKLKKDKIEFYILGQFEEKKYEKIIKKYEDKKIIKYLGIVSDVREEIKKVHCLINPSWHEGMSNVLLEAGAMKRFLICSNISGCKEIVVNDITGFTFERKNSKELEKKILNFLDLSNKKYKEYIMNSYKHITNNFSRSKIVELYLEEIEVK